jgi:membrane protein DedA with SNARE-associated domain
MIPAVDEGSGLRPQIAARFPPARGARLTEQLIGKLGYLGIALVLILGGLGLPIPEEAPIIVAAILTRNGTLAGPLAFASCLGGVLLGDLVVYLLGFVYGERVLSLPVTRRFLTRQREAQIKGYFHRHGFKILVSGRFVPGFRSAAYLTAGILKLPVVKLLATDVIAATLTTSLMFGLGYAFAHQIQHGIREVQQWVALLLAVGLASWLLYRHYQARRRAGRLVGPPVLDSDDVPLPGGESATATTGASISLEPPAPVGRDDQRDSIGGDLKSSELPERGAPSAGSAAAPHDGIAGEITAQGAQPHQLETPLRSN